MNRSGRAAPVPAAVFLDESGRRKRWVRVACRLVLVGFAGYLAVLVAALIRDPHLAAVASPSRRSSAGLAELFGGATAGHPAAAGAADGSASPMASLLVPDYAAAAAAGAASRPALPPSPPPSARPPSVHPGRTAPDPTGQSDVITVTTVLSTADWPLPPPPPRPTRGVVEPAQIQYGQAVPSAGTTTPTTTPPAPATQPSPPTTSTTTTAPEPAGSTTAGRGPGGQGPPGLLRKAAAAPAPAPGF